MADSVKVIESVMIDCPVDAVFQFVTNFENDRLWWNGVIDAKQISEHRDGVGTQYLQIVRLLGQTFEVQVEVIEYSPPHRITIQNDKGLTPFTAIYTFETVPQGTRFTMDSQVRAQGVFKLFQPFFIPLLKQQTKSNFQKLKTVAEARVCP
jgi:uncharacterized protein YndB with AHSA1/START domain